MLSLGCVGLFSIRGVSGDLVPIIGWRWSGQDRPDGASAETPSPRGGGRLPFRDYPQFLGPERNAILTTIRDCGGNRTQAAQVLGIDRSTLRRKIMEFGIE